MDPETRVLRELTVMIQWS